MVVSTARTKVKNAFKSLGTIRKKFLLLKTTKNARCAPSFKTRNKYKLLLSTLCCFMLSQVLVLNRGSGRRISLFRVIKQVENQMKPNKCVFCTSLTMLYFCTENERNVFHRKSTGRFLHGMPLKTPVTVSERT